MVRLLPLLSLLALAASCQDGGTALSVALQLGGPASCVRVTASGLGGAGVSSDIQVAPGTNPRTFTVAVYPGGVLGSGEVTLLAEGFSGACGAAPATQEARGTAAFVEGEVVPVKLEMRLLDPDSDGDGAPDSQDCAPEDPARFPRTGDEFDAACNNGADDDCDGAVDDGCPCVEGDSAPCHPLGLDWPGLGFGNCRTGVYTCQPDGGWGECTGAVSPAPELCNGLDDDCDGSEDEDPADAGQPCNSGAQGLCAAGAWLCSVGGLLCVPDVAPTAETCDGRDEDCDGQVDDGLPGVGQTCTPGVGACARAGTLHCLVDGGMACSVDAGHPSLETCNGVDDDCDGTADEEFPSLGTLCSVALGSCVNNGTVTCLQDGGSGCSALAPVPATERCNGLDDDCDGLKDEDFPGVGQPCSNGLVGACAAPGTFSCLPDGGMACTAPLIAPGVESCNGLDDDCDGAADEGYSVGAACDNGQPGACARTGTFTCTANGSAGCNAPAVTPGTESCNGVDDDCDGTVDDGFGVGQPCSVGVGACARAGTWICNALGGATCTSGGVAVTAGLPSREVCDGADNDCDGAADEPPDCGGPRADVAENAAVTWTAFDTGAASPSFSFCTATPAVSLSSVQSDTANAAVGAGAVRLNYGAAGSNLGSSSFTGTYPAGRTGGWDLSTTTGLAFQVKHVLPTNIAWEAAVPSIALCSSSGVYRTLVPTTPFLGPTYAAVAVPLAGNAGWTATSVGGFTSATTVNWVELHFDPRRSGNVGQVVVYLDDVRFY